MDREQDVYEAGDYKFRFERARFASIKEMKEKPGFVGKRISYEPKIFNTFENFKGFIELCSRSADEHLLKFLPKYYFTFQEDEKNPANSAAYFFMEEVYPRESHPQDKQWGELDDFISTSLEHYLETYSREGKPIGSTGIIVDLAERNLVYGTTLENRESKLYLVDLYPIYRTKSPSQIEMEAKSLIGPYVKKGAVFPKAEAAILKLTNLK